MMKRLLICMMMLLTFAAQTAWAQAGKFFDIDHLRSGLFINQLYIDRNGHRDGQQPCALHGPSS